MNLKKTTMKDEIYAQIFDIIKNTKCISVEDLFKRLKVPKKVHNIVDEVLANLENEQYISIRDTNIYPWSMILDPDFSMVTSLNGIKVGFSEESLKEMSVYKNFEIPEKEYQERKDLRDIFTITMDSLSAKDFDDAFSLQKEGNDFRLWVHTADVSYFVKKGSITDKEALERGNSYYLGPWVVPMLPPVLSLYQCSLMEGKERLSITCEILLDNKGKVLDSSIYRSIIRVDKKVPYEIGNLILENKNHELYEFLSLSAKLYKILYDTRVKTGSLLFDLPEYDYYFECDYLVPKAIIKYDRGICERIIEEFMLLTNKLIAKFGSKSDLFLFRIHEKPSMKSTENLKKTLASLGYKSSGTMDHNRINKLLNEIRGSDIQNTVETLVLRSLTTANYDKTNKGHFGLNFEKYTHFTSPIRRYADLTIHRRVLQILEREKNAIDSKDSEISNEEMINIALITSYREKIATDAELMYQKYKNARYIQNYIGHTFKATVVNIISKGVFCKIDDFGIDGLLPKEHLQKCGFCYDKNKNCYIKASGKTKSNIKKIGLGTSLNVIVSRVITNKGLVDYKLYNIKEELSTKSKEKDSKRGKNADKKKARRRTA